MLSKLPYDPNRNTSISTTSNYAPDASAYDHKDSKHVRNYSIINNALSTSFNADSPETGK